MGAKYDFLSIPSRKDDGKTNIIYPKMVFNETIPWERIVEEVARDSGFTPGTVLGVMNEVEARVLRYIGYGHRVQVGNMCYAEPTVELVDAGREVTDESELHAQSVRFGKVNMQPAKGFRPHGQLERADGFHKFSQSSSRLTSQERYGLLRAYLGKNGIITRTQYGELTGLLRSKAQQELSRWVAEGKLGSMGKAPHKIYKMAEGGGES